ncbi:protein YkfM [Escherichia albertii]|uniref:protein YkfM n=1 Tax=Escherichia albertii TaxID=208962 RepID=UPI0007443426|nr:protein YkfM [Escherichia albertii]
MRLHVKLKDFLSMFFIAILFFPAFNASLFFTGIKPLYSIIKGCTEIFYDWRMLILCFGFISFSFLNIHVILLTIIKSFLIKKTKVINFATDITMQLTLTFLLIAIAIAPLMAPFVTGYVNAHYHPCSNNKGIFSGAIYIKNGMECNNEYISHRDD